MIVDQIIARWKHQPFERGSTDCCAFVNYVIKELTGESYLPEYNDDQSAFAIIEKHGSLGEAVTHYVNQKPVPSQELKPGAIALIQVFNHQSIGIIMNNGNVAAVFEDHGLRECHSGFVDEGWNVWELKQQY